MAHFNEDQLKELETLYGLKRKVATLPIRDGVVAFGEKVWWRAEYGPEQVVADNNKGTWSNIRSHPQLYQTTRPRHTTTYVD